MLRTLTVVFLLGLVGCTAEPPPAPPVSGPEFNLVTNLHETMLYVLDPATDVVWGSAGSIITEDGEQDLRPTTQQGWDHVRNNAAIVAETGNLLMMPGRAMGESDWMELSRGLTNAGLLAMKAAEAQDDEALFEAGGQIYNVCKACHAQYIQGED